MEPQAQKTQIPWETLTPQELANKLTESLMNVTAFNTHREAHPDWIPDLGGVQLSAKRLHGANLSRAKISGMKCTGSHLTGANLCGAEGLETANLMGTDVYRLQINADQCEALAIALQVSVHT